MKGSPHSSQRDQQRSGKRSQTPDHMLSTVDHSGGVEMKPLHQVVQQTSLTSASSVQSPSVAQKVSRMGVPTPFAGATAVPSPMR